MQPRPVFERQLNLFQVEALPDLSTLCLSSYLMKALVRSNACCPRPLRALSFIIGTGCWLGADDSGVKESLTLRLTGFDRASCRF